MQTLREQLEGRCVHFRSIQHDTCKAGVRYDSIRKPIACFKWRVPAGTCAKLEWPSKEAVDAEIAVHAKLTSRMMLLNDVLAKVRKEHKNRYWRGVLVCPMCQGKLHVEHRPSNGHTSGKCETTDCYNWME